MFLTSNFTVKKYSKWCNLYSGNWKWDLGGQAIVKSWDRLAAEPLNWPPTLPSLLWELTQWKKIPDSCTLCTRIQTPPPIPQNTQTDCVWLFSYQTAWLWPAATSIVSKWCLSDRFSVLQLNASQQPRLWSFRTCRQKSLLVCPSSLIVFSRHFYYCTRKLLNSYPYIPLSATIYLCFCLWGPR